MDTRYEGSLQQASADIVVALLKMGLHPQHATVSVVLGFLHALFTQGHRCSAVNSNLSASNSILQVPGVERIGEHIFNLQAQEPRYSKMCDINKVVIYLKNLVGIKTLPSNFKKCYAVVGTCLKTTVYFTPIRNFKDGNWRKGIMSNYRPHKML